VGNTTDLYVERTLQKGGLTPADVSLTTMPIADMAGAMANGAIDAAWMFEPFTTLTTRAGIGRQVVDVSQVAPEFYLQFLLVAEQFAEQNPEAVRRFVTAHMRGQRDYYRAFVTRESPDSEREALIDQWVKYTAVKDRGLYEEMGYSAVEPNGYIDPAVPDIFQDWALQKGLIAQRVDMRKLIDPQYTEYAVGRLGRLPDPFR
jgi:NitT/TauT family transport system substrate-binding protein